jgi:hypothetical protein
MPTSLRSGAFYRYRREKRRLRGHTRGFRERSCKHKTRFPTQREADVVRVKSRDAGLDSYQCSFCRFFHLGHPTKHTYTRLLLRRKHLLLNLSELLTLLIQKRQEDGHE